MVAPADSAPPTAAGRQPLSENGADIRMVIINSPPTPPPGFVRPLAPRQGAYKSATSRQLAVPTSTWTYGCTATSAGMIFGYYDRNGYPNMYSGPTNGGVCPLTDLGQGDDPSRPVSGSCSIIATMNGFDGRTTPGHVNDYWISYESAGPDPWESAGTQHTWGDCTADYLGTNQWKWNYDGTAGTDSCTDGATWYFWDDAGHRLYDFIPSSSCGTPQTEACHGMRLFAESRGYTVLENYTQQVDAVVACGFSFTNYKTEIDKGCPVMIHVEGHTMVGVGYDDSTSPGTVYLHDTWDNEVHSMAWGGSYSGMAMQAVTIVHLAAAMATGTGAIRVVLEPADARDAGAQWCADGGEWRNSGATLADLPAVQHAVSFKRVPGYSAPADQGIIIPANSTARVKGTYTPTTGSLTVTLQPEEARSGGVQWQMDGGAWQGSGVTLNKVTAGQRFITFKSVSGWIAPASVTIAVTAGRTQTLQAGFAKARPLQDVLLEGFDGADKNNDGLSYAEAAALVPDISQEQFDALDADHDGRLSPEELGGASPGCHCSGAKSLGDWRHRAGDLFLIGLGLLSQALLSRVPRKF
ncbi:MAG: hypothetical protein GXY86_17915 [Firmicutes bacterium]|nr:hypothetical protein [Bacillota bacterium]